MAGGQEALFERFKIQCLNLIKLIMLCVEYKPAKVVEGMSAISLVTY